MRTALLILVLLIAPLLNGCATQTPERFGLQARQAANSTLAVLIEARKAGKISDEQAAHIREVRIAVYDALDAYDDAVRSGNKDAIELATQTVTTALLRWLELKEGAS